MFFSQRARKNMELYWKARATAVKIEPNMSKETQFLDLFTKALAISVPEDVWKECLALAFKRIKEK